MTVDIIVGPGNGSSSATKVVLVFVLVVSTKAFSFRNRLLLNFAHRLVTIYSTIATCRIFNLRGATASQLVTRSTRHSPNFSDELTVHGESIS